MYGPVYMLELCPVKHIQQSYVWSSTYDGVMSGPAYMSVMSGPVHMTELCPFKYMIELCPVQYNNNVRPSTFNIVISGRDIA